MNVAVGMRTALRRTCPALLAALALGVTGCGVSRTPDRPVAPAVVAGAARAAAPVCGRRVRLVITETERVGSGVGALVAQGQTVYAARAAAGTVTRVTGSARQVAHLGGTPVSLTLGFGKVWVALRDANEVVGLDAQSLVRRTAAGVETPVDLSRGADSIWALSLDEDALWQLSPSTGGGTELDAPVAGPMAMVRSGPELWVLGASEGGLSPVNAVVGRIIRVGFNIPAGVSGLSSSGGTLWLAEPAQRVLLRVSVADIGVSAVPAPGSMAPIATAATACGVWVADATGRVAFIDPSTGQSLAAPIRVGRSVARLAVTGGGVWASDPLDGTVVRVSAQPAP